MGTLILSYLKAEIQKGELLAQGHRAGCGSVDSDPGLFVYRAHTLYSAVAFCSEISPECPCAHLWIKHFESDTDELDLVPALPAMSAAVQADIT